LGSGGALGPVAAKAGGDRHVLLALVGVGDRRRIDARAGLELPERLAGVLVERHELAGELAGEHDPAAGRQHAGRAAHTLQWGFPFALTGERIKRNEITDHVVRLDLWLPGDHAGRGLADDLLLRRRELLDARQVPWRRVNQTLVRIIGERHRVCAARRKDLHLLAGKEVLVDAGELRPAAHHIDAGGPIDLRIWMRGDQPAVGAIEYVHEAVLVRLDHHLAHLPIDLQIGKHELVGSVHVVDVVRRELVIAGNLAGLWAYCEYRRGVEAVAAFTRPRVIRLRVAGPPIDKVEVGIVGAGAPGRAAAMLPGVIVGPGLRARLALRPDRVAAPELLAGLRVPAVEEAARGGFAARHPGDQHAVGDDRRAGGVVALLPVGELLRPHHPAGLELERDEIIVDRHTEQLAVIVRRRAAIECVPPPLHVRFDLHRRAPDLLAGLDVDRDRPLAVDDVHDAVVDDRGGKLAHVVLQARAPDRNQALDV